MGDATAWEALRDGTPVAERPTREEVRALVRDEVEQRVGDLIDGLAWQPADGGGEELWLRAGGDTTQSGWAIRPTGGGGRDA